MTDAQIIAISITVLAILGGVLINNARIGDVKETLRAEMNAHRAEVKAEVSALRVEINDRFNAIENKLDTILRMLADVDQRVTKLEARP